MTILYLILTLIVSQFQTERTKANFEGFVWDAIKLYVLNLCRELQFRATFSERAYFLGTYKNMAS